MKLALILAFSASAYACPNNAPHCNVLTILAGTQPSGVIVTGFNIYKASTSGAYSTTPLATLPAGTLTYTDSAVTSGQTNFYVATTKCDTCTPKETVPSGEIKLLTPPDAPSAIRPALQGMAQ